MPFEILEKTNTSVSAVVDIIDGFTGKPVILPIKFTIDKSKSIIDRHTEIIKKDSSRYVFIGPPPKTLEYQITSDYLLEETNNPLLFEPTANSDVIRKKIKLCPLPCYPFSAGTTVFRGMVVDPEGMFVKNAAVLLSDISIPPTVTELTRTTTSERGEFVYYFKPAVLNAGNSPFKIITIDGVPYLVPKSATSIENSMALKVEGSSEGAYPIKIVWGISSSLGKNKQLILS